MRPTTKTLEAETMSQADRTKWDERYAGLAAAGPGCGALEPAAFLVSVADHLPRQGRALDIAGGAGRNALWLAARGLDVTLVDISTAALRLADQAAAAAGVRLNTLAADLDTDPLPVGPWHAVLSFHFLWPPLFELVPSLLAPGGLLVYVQPTRKNLERNASPSRRFLLEDGRLPELVSGLDILHYEEGWQEGRHEARLLARRPQPAVG